MTCSGVVAIITVRVGFCSGSLWLKELILLLFCRRREQSFMTRRGRLSWVSLVVLVCNKHSRVCWSAASVCVQVTMSSSESKRTREQTSPTGNTPYAASKKSAREATLEFLEAGEDS